MTAFLLLTAVSLTVQGALCIAAAITGFIHGADGHDLTAGQPARACYRLGRWARARRDQMVRDALADTRTKEPTE